MDSSAWLSIILALISSGVVGTIITTISNRHADEVRRKEEERRAQEQKTDSSRIALRLLIQDKLEFFIEKEINAGITSKARHKMINEMYKAYKGLDGNGDMEWLMSEYDKVHLKKDETEV